MAWLTDEQRQRLFSELRDAMLYGHTSVMTDEATYASSDGGNSWKYVPPRSRSAGTTLITDACTATMECQEAEGCPFLKRCEAMPPVTLVERGAICG